MEAAKSIFSLSILLLVSITMSWSQVDGFDIDYPRSENTSRIEKDSSGFYWLHDEKDFYFYNGHQIKKMGLGDLLGKKKYDYSFTGDIIIINEELIFSQDQVISSLNPSSSQIRDIWKLPSGQDFDHIYQDDLGHIWVFARETSSGKRPIYISIDGTTFEYAFDLSEHIGSRGIFWDFEIDDKEGVLYIQWRLGGLVILDRFGKTVALNISDQSDYQSKSPCSMYRLDNRNRLWRIWDMQFQILDDESGEFVHHPLTGKYELTDVCNMHLNKSLLNLRSLYVDSKDRVWMSFAASYMIMYDPLSGKASSFRKELVEHLEGGDFDIKSISEDLDGNIWGNKVGGLFKIRDKLDYFDSYASNMKNANHELYNGKEQKTIKKINDFFGDYAIRNTTVHSVSVDKDQNIYFQDGTYTFKVDRKTEKAEILPIFSPRIKTYFYKDDHLSILSSWDNYYLIDENYNSKKLKYPINKIEVVFRQNNGDVWLSGLLDQHRFMFGKLNKETLEFENNLVPVDKSINFERTQVTSIDEDSRGLLWLGTDMGVLSIHTDNTKIDKLGSTFQYLDSSKKIGDHISQLFLLNDDLLWLRTKYEIVLVNISTREIIHYLQLSEDRLGADITFLPEGDSAIWIGSQRGLEYHNFPANIEFVVDSESGLDSKGAINVIKKVSDQKICLGTNNGLFIFSSQTIISEYAFKDARESNIPIYLTGYSYVDGATDQSVSHDIYQTSTPEIMINYNDRGLKLEFALANFDHPDRQMYSYKIVGYDSDWSDAKFDNTATYSNLPPGDYNFTAKGTMGNGIWSKNLLPVSIVVKQAWFWSWWFITLCLFSLGYIVFKVTTYFQDQKLTQALELQKLRSNISRDLHDDVGTILTGIAMQSELLENFADSSTKNLAQQIAVNCRKAMGNMRDTVWAIDSRRDKVRDLRDRMMDFLDDTLAPKDIDYEINKAELVEERNIKPNLRQTIYLIFKESITNIIKHSDTQEVSIFLSIERDSLCLDIKDKGGKQAKPESSGSGLQNMRSRAEALGGTYSFEYNGSGYQTLVNIPI